MKNSLNRFIVTAALILSFTSSSKAFAVWAPNWERPLLQSNMDVIESNGAFEQAHDVTLVMNKRDNSKEAATSLTLEFTVEHKDGSLEDFSYVMPIQDIKYTRCGTTYFNATLKLYDPDMATGYFPEVSVVLERKGPIMLRGCGQIGAFPGSPRGLGRALLADESRLSQKNLWLAKVEFKESGSVQSLSVMKLKGAPSDVFTIQGLESR